MNVSPRFVVLAALLVAAGSAGVFATACSSGGNNPADGGSDAAKDGAVKKEAGPTGDGGGGGDAAQVAVDPQCTVPAIGSGSCSPPLDDAGINCNAITNAGCDGGAGETCDFDQGGGLSCFPPPNDQALCASCDNTNGPFCQPSEHCVPTANGSSCARMCCTDSDCTPGHCDTQTLGFAPIGVCVK